MWYQSHKPINTVKIYWSSKRICYIDSHSSNVKWWNKAIQRSLRFRCIGVRAGGGARGAAAPPNFGRLRFFGQQEKIGAKPVFNSLRTADVSPRSSPLRNVLRGGMSATQQQKFHTDDVKSVWNPVRSANWSTE